MNDTVDDDRVEVIVTRILNGKLENYRHIKLCDERHEGVNKMEIMMKWVLGVEFAVLLAILGVLLK